MVAPDLIAFDFDGVICDGLIEYFQTAWRAYTQLFEPEQPAEQTPPEGLAEQFYPLRPVIETGWEMPVLVAALVQGAREEPQNQAALHQQIVEQWPAMALTYLDAANLTKKQSVTTLDGIRDQWIKSDLPSWLALHRFYPGMIERVSALLTEASPVYIVSTKEGRFIQALLAQSGLDFPRDSHHR